MDTRKKKQNTLSPEESLPSEEMRSSTSLGEQSIIKLCREQLQGLQLDEVKVYDDLTEEEKLAFAQYCFGVYNSKFFKTLIKYLVDAQIHFSIRRAESWIQTLFGRATINGISLIDECFEKYARKFEALTQPEDTEKPEPGSIIGKP